MKTKQWLEQVVLQLRSSGLPNHYIRRTTMELADHWEQCEQFDPEFDDKLERSPPSELASQFIDTYRRAKWFRRIPSIVLVFATFPLGLLCCFVYYVAGIGVMEVTAGGLGNDSKSDVEAFFLPWLSFTGKLVTPLIAVYALQKVLGSVGRPRWVNFISTAMLALLFLATSTDFQVPIGTLKGGFHLTVSDETFLDKRLLMGSALQSMVVLLGTFVFWRRSDLSEPILVGSTGIS